LGSRILKYLSRDHATIRCLVRKGISDTKKSKLTQYGAELVEVDFNDLESIVSGCQDGSVVVSALSGLDEVILTVQSRLLDGAVRAGVPRFIPSDYAIDYRKIPIGENRNLNLRLQFMKKLDAAPIQATSILNGAFTDMLTGVAPFVLFKINRVLCWGNRDQLMDWTTIDNTAEFVAKVAQDQETPRFLKIAGDEVSAKKFVNIMSTITGKKYKILKPGGLSLFGLFIWMTKLFVPGRGQVYPPWQGMQYMFSMYKGDCKFDQLDNDRYPIKWVTATDVLEDYIRNPNSPTYQLDG